jgi:23S rRNA (pseudouridine1915-N3)-methyltransferase
MGKPGMKLRLLWVGKTQESWVKTGIDEYAGRVRRYFPLEIAEAKEEKGAEAEKSREREAERLLKLLPASAKLILLDEHGAQLTSPEFAALIERERDRSTPELAFAIGGAYGFAASLRERAIMSLGLSKMTFTHQMVRPFFLEQLYRACTILNNEQYHH